MTAQQFYEILGDIDEKFVKEAEMPLNRKKHLWWKATIAVAAGFAIIFLAAMTLPHFSNRGSEFEESSELYLTAEQKDVKIYYVNGDELEVKSEYLECSPEKVFDSWKQANEIGDEVKLIKAEVKSNGQESFDSATANYSVGDRFVMEVTLSKSFQDYFSLKPEEKLMESLRLTMTGFSYIEYDEFHVIYE